VAGIRSGNIRAIARAITLVEDQSPRAQNIMRLLSNTQMSAHIVGVTGSPGAGKSTLVDQIAAEWQKMNKKVAIVAVDPSSPFSGGAVLGDRIRMNRSAEASDIYIRSMATRGALGGIARATLEVTHILNAASFDVIIVETVGVGQAEVDIIKTADTCALVLVPGMGDMVQAIKAGIVEIADIFVINKSDRDGAELLHRDLKLVMSLGDYSGGKWEPPILKTIATDGTGTADLVLNCTKHREWLKNGTGRERRLRIIRDQLTGIIAELASSTALKRADIDGLTQRCFSGELSPYDAATKFFSSLNWR
jgi:LAO/AO transport system kinase